MKTVPGSRELAGVWKRPRASGVPWAGPSCAQMEEPRPAGPASQTVGSTTDRQLTIHGRKAKTSASAHLEAESSDQKQIRNGHSPYQSSILV